MKVLLFNSIFAIGEEDGMSDYNQGLNVTDYNYIGIKDIDVLPPNGGIIQHDNSFYMIINLYLKYLPDFASKIVVCMVSDITNDYEFENHNILDSNFTTSILNMKAELRRDKIKSIMNYRN